MPTIINYFDRQVVNKIIKKIGKAKVITATNVFAHIDKIDELIKNILKLMKPDGVFVSESHYFLSLVETLQYDTIYHEHLRYYTVTSLKNIFNKYGLKIIKVKNIKTHGGSIRVYATKNKAFKVHKSIKKALKKEKKYLSKKNLKIFKSKVLKSKIDLLEIIKKIKFKNHNIFAVGAPSRATTLVNYVGINEEMVDYICEIRVHIKLVIICLVQKFLLCLRNLYLKKNLSICFFYLGIFQKN